MHENRITHVSVKPTPRAFREERNQPIVNERNGLMWLIGNFAITRNHDSATKLCEHICPTLVFGPSFDESLDM